MMANTSPPQQQSSSSSSTFEIKIAVLGYVSAGKRTFLGALLRDKYKHSSGTGINYLRLSHRSSKQGNKLAGDSTAAKSDLTAVKESSTSSSSSFLESSVASDFPVKLLDIEMDEPLCEMREDTKLVLVDVPGLNEAGGPGRKYRAYVTDKWDTFDCAILVLDGSQQQPASSGTAATATSVAEQVHLLEFVKNNNDQKKEIPVIILFNKVDDPDDKEQAPLVKQVRKHVERVFKVPDREGALTTILGLTTAAAALHQQQDPTTNLSSLSTTPSSLFPAFIPTSAALAQMYRMAALMTLDDFAKKYDSSKVEVLGLQHTGMMQWRKMSQEERVRLVYDAIRDPFLLPATNQEGGQEEQSMIGTTNFETVLKVLAFTVGGQDRQLQLIQKQNEVALRALSLGKNIASQIRSLHENFRLLGKPTLDLQAAFWKTHDKCAATAFQLFAKSPMHVDKLASLMAELIEYHKFASSRSTSNDTIGNKDIMSWENQQNRALARMKEIVRIQIGTILGEASRARADYWASRCEPQDATAVDWASLHPIDWKGVCKSLLLLSYDRHFCESFGREKMLLEDLEAKNRGVMNSVPDFGRCKSCPGNTKLDFNHFCGTCKIFYTPTNWTGSDGFIQRFKPGFKCRQCNKTGGNRGYCTCGSGQPMEPYQPSYKAIATSSLAHPPSLRLFCGKCSNKDKPLNLNRYCASCDIFFYMKGSRDGASKQLCVGCRAGSLSGDGRCSNQNCNMVAWKEYPYSLWEDLLSCAYDSKDGGSLKPKHPETYKSVVRLGEVPQSLSDRRHFGHVAWQYSKFMASLE